MPVSSPEPDGHEDTRSVGSVTSTHRLRAASLAAVLAATSLAGCGDDDSAGGSNGAPMGWIDREDEPTGVVFSLPPPISGPEDARRPGRTTAVATRSYGSRSGDLAISVQLLSTPEDPDALRRELPPRSVPRQVLDRIRTDGDYDGEVLSNEPVEGLAEPAYDARLRVTSDEEEAFWWMRTRALDEVVVVTQVVAFSDDTGTKAERADLETQGETAFDRLNRTVEVP